MDLNTDLVTNLDLFLKLKESGSLKNSDFIVNYIKQNVPLPLRDDQIRQPNREIKISEGTENTILVNIVEKPQTKIFLTIFLLHLIHIFRVKGQNLSGNIKFYQKMH